MTEMIVPLNEEIIKSELEEAAVGSGAAAQLYPALCKKHRSYICFT